MQIETREAGLGGNRGAPVLRAATMLCFLLFLMVFAGRWVFGRAAPAARGAL